MVMAAKGCFVVDKRVSTLPLDRLSVRSLENRTDPERTSEAGGMKTFTPSSASRAKAPAADQ